VTYSLGDTILAYVPLINSIGAVIVRRINFPKVFAGRMTRRQSENARLRPLLSASDEADAKQTVALALCQLGLPVATQQAIARAERIAALCPLFGASKCERASYANAARTLGMERWKACFRAVRRELRIDRRVREDATDFSTAPEIEIVATHPEISQERRDKLARQITYARALLHAAYGADTSRKRRATFHTHLSTLRAFSAIWGGRLASRPLCAGDSEAAIRVTLFRFRSYLEKGEVALTQAALADAPRYSAKVANAIGELKTFAALA
jgi:hypothetical protein